MGSACHDRPLGRAAGPQVAAAAAARRGSALLRLAAWELINTQTPPKVVIAEAIELAKQFSTEQSARFVNGVLDSLLKEHLALTDKSQLPQA